MQTFNCVDDSPTQA